MAYNSKRRWIGVILTTCFSVGLIVFLTLFNPVEEPDQPDEPPTTTQQEITDVPPTPGANPTTTSDINLIGENTVGWVQRQDPKTGKLAEEFRWDTLNPENDGLFNVTKPQARMYLDDNRVLHMTSDSGQIIAPGNYPKSGEFRGNVVITLFEVDPALKRGVIIANDSPDITMRIFLDGVARFDSTLGTIESFDELFFTSTEAEMKGRGMKLTYNQPGKRIDYFEITHGDFIRFAGKSLNEKTEAGITTTGNTTADVKPSTPASDTTAQQNTEPIQYYKVVLEHQVVITSEGRTINADSLNAWLAITQNKDKDQDKPTDAQAGDNKTTTPVPVTADAESANQVITRKSIMKHSPTDALVHWKGRLVLTPENKRPVQFSTPNDLYVELTGKPITVTTEKQEKLSTQKIVFLDSAKSIRALSTQAYPLTIESDQLGKLTSEELNVQLTTNTATLIGKGIIRAPKQKPEPNTQDTDKPSSLPPGMIIRWTKQVAINYLGKDQSDTVQSSNGVKNIQFLGGVNIEDEQFTLYGSDLNIIFDHVDPKTKDRKVSTIIADKGVFVEVEDGIIESRRLQINMKLDAEGTPQPSVMIAQDEVYVADKSQRLWTNYLLATLAETSDKTKKTSSRSKETKEKTYTSELKTMTARNGVRLLLVDDETLILADQLQADAVKGTANVIGTPVRIYKHPNAEQFAKTNKIPATLKQGNELRVIQLQISQDGKLALAPGLGEFHYIDQPDPNSKQLPRRVDVTWERLLRFAETTDTIKMLGDVKMAVTETPREVNTLNADDVTIELVDRELMDKIRAKTQDKKPTLFSGEGQSSSKRILRKLTAKEKVNLTAQRWKDDARTHTETRFVLRGNNLVFDDALQRATVTGPGNLQIEDYRDSKSSSSSSSKAGEKKIMSGKGASLFEWTGDMLMDASKQKININGNVIMTHQPLKDQKTIILEANRLEADFKDKAKIAVNRMSQVESFEMEHILVEGDVEIRQDNRIITAPVRAYYSGEKQTILLQGTDDQPVTVIILNQPKPLRAKYILWNLQQDRFEVIQGEL